MHVTIFGTGGKVRPSFQFYVVARLTEVARSYALLLVHIAYHFRIPSCHLGIS